MPGAQRSDMESRPSSLTAARYRAESDDQGLPDELGRRGPTSRRRASPDHDLARSRPSCCASFGAPELDVEQSTSSMHAFKIRVRRLRDLGPEWLGDVMVDVDPTRVELAAVGSCPPLVRAHEPESEPLPRAQLGVGGVSRGGETGQDLARRHPDWMCINEAAAGHATGGAPRRYPR